MPMNWDIRECENLTEETKQLFFGGLGIYSPFQTLCNWLYQTKFNYGDRKGDSFLHDNHVVLTEIHIDDIIGDGLIQAVDPQEYNENVLRKMLMEFVGLKVWGN